MLPTREQFCEIIKKIKNYEDWYDQIQNINIKFDEHFHFTNSMIIQVVELLEIVLDDTEKYISWWIWERNFGLAENKKPCLWDNKNNPIDVSSPELFYDFLIENRKKCI